MIKIPESICKECGLCCHGKSGEYIFANHNGVSPQISAKGKCQYLNNKNKCKLGYRKPIECQLYPIRIFSDGVYIDKQCPGWRIALEQWKITHGVSMKEWNNRQANYIKV